MSEPTPPGERASARAFIVWTLRGTSTTHMGGEGAAPVTPAWEPVPHISLP